MTSMFRFFATRSTHKITPQLLIAAMTASALSACGGGGGGAAAEPPSRSITSANEKQVVAAVIRSIELMGTSNGAFASAPNVEAASRQMRGTQSKQAIARAETAKAVREIEDACEEGRLLVDDESGEETYENCTWSTDGVGLRLNGSILTQDLTADPAALFDTKITYSNFSMAALLSSVDSLTSTLNGSILEAYTETSDNAEADLAFNTAFVCKGVSGGYGGAYKLTMASETTGDESAYTENGEISFTGFDDFSGTLTVVTLEPMRYRDDFNENYPYAGNLRFTAVDGSAIDISFAEGGLYVNQTFYTWEQYDAQFLVDDALTPCLTP